MEGLTKILGAPTTVPFYQTSLHNFQLLWQLQTLSSDTLSKNKMSFGKRSRWRSRRIHLPQKTHQKYIYMWSNSHWKLTEYLQKDSCITNDIRKIHTELNRKGRKMIRSGPVALGRDSEKEGVTWVEIFSGKWMAQAIYWAPQSWSQILVWKVHLAGFCCD